MPETIRASRMVLVNLSNLNWVSARRRRNQAIFSHLLSDTDAFESGLYVQPPIVVRARTRDFLSPPRIEMVSQTGECGKPVTILQPVFSLPWSYRSLAVKRYSTLMIERGVQRGWLHGKPYLLWMNSISPLHSQLAERLAPRAVHRIFDSSDDFTMYDRENMRASLEEQQRVLNAADRVLCVNAHVYDKIHHRRKKVFNNCTEFQAFQRPGPSFLSPPLFPKPQGSVYIGFIGMIAGERFDMDLLRTTLRAFPDFRFVFVGNTNRPSVLAELTSYANVSFVPEVPHTKLSSIIHSFNVAIVPHVSSEYTRGNDLLKVLDYLACGVPVVSTVSSNVERYGRALYTSRTPAEFLMYLEKLTSGALRHDPHPGLNIARDQSWEKRVPELLPWILGSTTLEPVTVLTPAHAAVAS